MAKYKQPWQEIDEYQKENYDRIVIKVKKGERAKIDEFAKRKGTSRNSFIIELIKKEMEKDCK